MILSTHPHNPLQAVAILVLVLQLCFCITVDVKIEGGSSSLFCLAEPIYGLFLTLVAVTAVFERVVSEGRSIRVQSTHKVPPATVINRFP